MLAAGEAEQAEMAWMLAVRFVAKPRQTVDTTRKSARSPCNARYGVEWLHTPTKRSEKLSKDAKGCGTA